MKVLHVSTSDIGHGAGVAAYRLHDALNRNGHHSRMLVAEKLSEDETVFQLPVVKRNYFRALVDRADHGFEYLVNHLGPQNYYSVLNRQVHSNSHFAEADIIHLNNLHWHSRNFSPLMIPEIGRAKKIVWTLHDMWAFTGHCIYSYDCERWRHKCGHCPDLKSYIRLIWDTTRWLCNIKQLAYAKVDLHIVTPSKWLGSLASQSPLFLGCNFHQIPYSVDQRVFYPRKKIILTKHLLPEWQGQTILFLSSYLNDERKGYSYFEAAVFQLAKENSLINIRVIAVGRGQVSERLKSCCHVIETGTVTDRDVLAEIYSVADIFVMPSIQDNLPNTVLESMACGTPVVCFDAGGMPDMVVHRECGYIARFRDTYDLAEGIRELLSDPKKLNDMSMIALRRVENSFSEKIQVEKHMELYQSILSGHD